MPLAAKVAGLSFDDLVMEVLSLTLGITTVETLAQTSE